MCVELVAAAALGVNVHLPPTDKLDLAKELGSGWVRIDFDWDFAEPDPGNYNWAPFDALVDDASARGLSVFATIGYTPAWASVSGDSGNDGPKNDVPDKAAYGAFVQAAAARYADGRVKAWGTWNEPNLGDFFEGTQQQWIDQAFTVAVDAISAGCPSCLIVGPELASIGDEYDSYLRAALQARGSALDAVSWHIYSAFPEDDANAGKTKDSFYNELEEHRVVSIGSTVVHEGPLSVREVLIGEGFSSLPVWITETGKNASPGNAAEEEEQRKYVERVLAAMVQRKAWWHKTFFYELTEEHPNGLWPDAKWGFALRVADPDATYADNFQKKKVFDYLAGCIGEGAAGTAGSGGASGGAAGASGGGAGGAGAGAGAASGSAAAESDDAGGCGCRTPARSPGGLSGALLLALAALFGARRRR